MTIPSIEHLPMVDAPASERRGLGTLQVAGRPALPLARVSIAARVADRVAGVTVEETFENPYPEHLEASYIFPLSGGAAVTDFELRVGARVIRGKVEERGEARRQYQQALDEGRRAALLEQERDDLFTVQVGNLPPGEEVTVRLSYSERLPFHEDGTTELRLPLVVAPRYVPGRPLSRNPVGEGVEPDTDLVPDASRITPPRLAPGFDPKVALKLEVELLGDGGAIEIGGLGCSQHATRTSLAAGTVKVALARDDEPLDRDFVLRWRVATGAVRPSLLAHRGDGGCYALLSIAPPRREGFLGAPRDVVFVLDRSGSMGGVKMTSAARACSLLLSTLGPRDRFAIQAFDDRVEWMADGDFVRADEAGLARGERWLREVDARGGTELDGAMAAALSAVGARGEKEARVPVIVLLTDGQVGDESRVLKRIQRGLGDARVFTVGIDTAVAGGFLKRLASLGGGTSTFVEPGAQLEEALRAVGREIGSPLVIDLKIEDAGAGLEEESLAPARMPDLFAGRAATVLLRMKQPGKLRVRGRLADGKKFDATVEARVVELPAVAHLWARARASDLEDRFRLDPAHGAKWKQQIIDLAIAHTLLTRFTAFVVVDESEVVNADGTRRKVVQPVAMPARWEMEAAMDAMPTTTRAGSITMSSMPAAMAPPPMRPAPMPSFAPPAPSGGGSRAKGTLAKVASRISEYFSGETEADDDGTVMKDAAPVATPSERKAIGRALESFAKALSEAKDALAAGRLPDAAALEAARRKLVEALAGADVGADLAALQRFLRSAAVELVAALRAPGATAPSVSALFARHARAFEEARREARALLDGGEAFWDASV